MDEVAARLRAPMTGLGRARRNTSIPAPLRAEGMAWVVERRRAGASGSLVLVTTQGVRLEGLTREDAVAVVRELGRDPLLGQCFLFVSRLRTRDKVLFHDGTGLCLYRVPRSCARWRGSSSARTRSSMPASRSSSVSSPARARRGCRGGAPARARAPAGAARRRARQRLFGRSCERRPLACCAATRAWSSTTATASSYRRA
ncbi:MAG: IS66 family insertion sequence element accessory protein TnpB [Deltaproteobacteria bacterium]|nr:IS66 family insertion sequence element accessory protein TnpB [Deltaproteobacteria bacterium]